MIQCPVPAVPLTLADARHGTQYNYRYRRCRCSECKAWNAAAGRAYQRKLREARNG